MSLRPTTGVSGGKPLVDRRPPPVADYQALEFEAFSRYRSFRFNRLANRDELNRCIAREAVDTIKRFARAGESLLMILPVGPLDYRYWARLINEENVSCQALTTLCMDEYLDDRGELIDAAHPLSFRGLVQRTLIDPIRPELRPPPSQVQVPDPRAPEATTERVESFGGAAICYGGMGINGHLAFNDPPEPGENLTDDDVRQSRTRCVTLSRESTTQMAVGGVNGAWELLPRRAVTLGMHELLLSRRLHLTFMRRWHAGVLRRALFGPIGAACPGSFVQEHPGVEVTMTRLAAVPPECHVLQATGEEADL